MALIRLYMTRPWTASSPVRRTASPLRWATGGFRLFNWLDRRDDPGPNAQVFGGAPGHPGRRLRPPHLRARRPLAGRPSRRRPGLRPDPRRFGRPPARQRPLRHRRARGRGPGPRGGRRRRRDGARRGCGAGVAASWHLDELELHVVPVLLGQGRACSTTCRPSTSSSTWRPADDRRRRAPAQQVMHLRYRIRGSAGRASAG